MVLFYLVIKGTSRIGDRQIVDIIIEMRFGRVTGLRLLRLGRPCSGWVEGVSGAWPFACGGTACSFKKRQASSSRISSISRWLRPRASNSRFR